MFAQSAHKGRRSGSGLHFPQIGDVIRIVKCEQFLDGDRRWLFKRESARGTERPANGIEPRRHFERRRDRAFLHLQRRCMNRVPGVPNHSHAVILSRLSNSPGRNDHPHRQTPFGILLPRFSLQGRTADADGKRVPQTVARLRSP